MVGTVGDVTLFRRRAAEPIDVLFVCTGNLCRSPMMQVILKAMRPELTVRSAGTRAANGRSWHPHAVRVLEEAGYSVDPAEALSRKLVRADVRAAPLILTAEGRHRSDVIRLDPTAEERTFTLLEAARLIGEGERRTDVRELRDELARLLATADTEADDDLFDPITSDVPAFITTGDAIRTAVAALFE